MRNRKRFDGNAFAIAATLFIGGLTAALWTRGRTAPTPAHVLSGHRKVVSSVAWSPDGKRLATGSWDKTVRVWNVATGQTERILTRPKGEVNAVSWSPDGTVIAAASEDAAAYLWNATSGAMIGPRRLYHHDSVNAAVFSPDGAFLATSGRADLTVKTWNTRTWTRERALIGHKGWAGAVAISPDSRSLATGAQDTVRLWDAASDGPPRLLSGSGPFTHFVSWSPSGEAFVCGGSYSQTRLYDTRTWRVTCTIPRRFTNAAFSPNGATLLTTSDFRVELWDVATGKLKTALVGPGYVPSPWPTWILRWIPALRPARAPAARVQAAAFSPDGRTIAYATDTDAKIIPVPTTRLP